MSDNKFIIKTMEVFNITENQAREMVKRATARNQASAARGRKLVEEVKAGKVLRGGISL